jgi:hypothetical protein
MSGSSRYMQSLALLVRVSVMESSPQAAGNVERGGVLPAGGSRDLADLFELDPNVHRLRQGAALKLREGAPLTRAEVAAYLGVSTRMVQRMEHVKRDRMGEVRVRARITRCPGFAPLVRYPARDVLRLASAMGKERL